MSPGLAKMSARAAGAVPFTPGAGLVGITLTGKRLGRHAEADGRAAAAVITAEAAAIAARTLVPLPPPARWSRCRRPRQCPTSCMSPSTARACR
jgi:hypothetical protein